MVGIALLRDTLRAKKAKRKKQIEKQLKKPLPPIPTKITTTKPSVQAMAQQFRQNPDYSDLRVILVKDLVTGNSGVDYLNEDNEAIWFPVNSFVKKPVDAAILIPEIEKLIK